MENFTWALWWIVSLIVLLSSVGHTAIKARLETTNIDESTSSSLKRLLINLFKNKMFIISICGFIYPLISITNEMNERQNHNQSRTSELHRLGAKSEPHKILVSVFMQCEKQSRLSEQGCLLEMKAIADIEGLTTEFHLVYQDVKNVIAHYQSRDKNQ